jgi:hypothetical protein
LKYSLPAQLALGFRFEHGITVGENCETSVAYLEQPARLSVEYVSRTHGLDTLERNKLNLIGPFILPEGGMQLERLYQRNTYNLDIVELLDLQGTYGSSESLNYLGVSYMQGSG